jgi:ActR/RegA family two-component response regulator
MAGIWILEPDEKLGESLSTAIRNAGLKAINFHKGSTAISAIKKDPPGLIILDLAIDDGKGLAVCHAIRGMPGVDLVPILFLGGGEGGVMSFGDALAEGGDYFFSKPPEAHKVVSKILTYVGIDRETPTIETTPAPATDPVVNSSHEVSSHEAPLREEQTANLAGRVEQMLNLGSSFKEGLLGPPDATEDADTRLARLEQEILNEGIRTEAGRTAIPTPSIGKKTRDETPVSNKEIISESVPSATSPSPAPPEKISGGVVLQAPVGSTHVTDEESAEAVFAKLAAELFEEKSATVTSGEKDKPIIVSPESGIKPTAPSPPPPESRRQAQKPKTIAKHSTESDSRRDAPPTPSVNQKHVAPSARKAAEPASAMPEAPSKPEPAPTLPEQQVEKPEKRLEQKESVVVSQLPPHPPTTNPKLVAPASLTTEVLRTDTDNGADQKTVNPPDSAPEQPRDDNEPDAAREDPNTPVQPLRPTLVRRTYHQRRTVPSPLPDDRVSPVEKPKTAAFEPRESLPDDEPAKHIDELFVPKPAPSYRPPDPVTSELSSEAVPSLLWRLHTQKVTGKVLVRSGSSTKVLFFEDGVPVGIHSTVAHERLEELLLREGLLDRAAYTEARVKDLASSRQLAAHLVERGFLRANELFPTVRRHLEEGVIALFEWDTGSVTFENDLVPDMEKVRLSRPLAASIMAGIRRKFLLERLIQELGGPASLIAPTPKEKRTAVTPDSEALGLTRQEREIFQLVNGLRPIEEIVFISGCDAALVYRVLFTGVVTGLLTVLVKGIRPSEGESEARERELAIGKRRIEAKLEHVNRGSYFDILGVSEKASPYEIEQAYQRASREFHPVQFAHPSYQNVSSQLALIRRTLDEAYEVLSDDVLREDYRRSLSSVGGRP